MATKETKTGSKPVSAPKPRAKAAPAPKTTEAAVVADAPAKPALPPVAKAAAAPKPSPKPEPAPIVDTPAEPTIVAEAATPVETVAEAVVEVTEAVVEAISPVAAPAPETAQKEFFTMTNTVETMTAKSQEMFADMNDRAKAAMEKNAKMVEEMNELAKGHMEAMVESGKIAAKGIESMGQEAAEFSRKSFESATAAMKTMASVKSPTELFKLQGDFVRQAFDSMVAEASKNTESMMKLAGDAAQPISNRVAVATDKMKIAA